MQWYKITLLAAGWLLIIATALPLVKSDNWVFRIFEYPRYQKLVLSAIVLILLAIVTDYAKPTQWITLVLLVFCCAFLIYNIWPYTSLAKKEMLSVAGTNKSNQVKLFTANIYEKNNQYLKVINQVKEQNPDIVLLIETDDKWEQQMRVLEAEYPHAIKVPMNNTYGMLMYSRLEVVEHTIHFLVKDDIPSIEAVIKLPSGQPVKFWSLHPRPPVPGEDSRSTAKDKELMLVAFKVEKEKLPVVVMGDLNDVAWSYVTRLFRKTSRLLDPRRGRGFYSTFSANAWFMRFPLDYVFCSASFGLIDMKRLAHNGSDHFPMFIHFEFDKSLAPANDPPKADSEEKQEAAEIATEQTGE